MVATQGADMSTQLNAVTAHALYQAGMRFVVRYLGTGDPAKALLSGEPALIRAAGLNLVLVWEGNPTYGGYFSYSQGLSDARAAAARARALGVPGGLAIYFAVDFDAQSYNMSAIASYVQGLKAGIGSYKVGVYGGYAVISYLHANEPVPYYWQTYAWSGGQVASFAQLYQYQNGQYIGGVTVDRDTANGNPGWWAAGATGATGSALGSFSVSGSTTILGLGLLAAAGYFGWRYYQQKVG